MSTKKTNTNTAPKGTSPSTYKASASYFIGVKLYDDKAQTILPIEKGMKSYYGIHTMGEKAVLQTTEAAVIKMTKADAKRIIKELQMKFPKNSYTLFRDSK
jgi:hypothetical protein